MAAARRTPVLALEFDVGMLPAFPNRGSARMFLSFGKQQNSIWHGGAAR